VQFAASGIGTLCEKHLHASLKRWYARPGDRTEIAVDGYVVDLVRDDLLIEIQTRGFSELRPKVTALLTGGHRLRIVHPIAVDRWIVRVDADGTFLGRRRSPLHGGLADLAPALVSIPDLLAHPGFEIEVLLIAEEEYRRHEAGRCWRRRGWTVVERRLVDVVDRVLLAQPSDLARLLPDGLPERFTTADIALGLGRPPRIAQQLAYCLRSLGLIAVVGTRGRAVEYQVADWR
jgi:hypothetical protein